MNFPDSRLRWKPPSVELGFMVLLSFRRWGFKRYLGDDDGSIVRTGCCVVCSKTLSNGVRLGTQILSGKVGLVCKQWWEGSQESWDLVYSIVRTHLVISCGSGANAELHMGTFFTIIIFLWPFYSFICSKGTRVRLNFDGTHSPQWAIRAAHTWTRMDKNGHILVLGFKIWWLKPERLLSAALTVKSFLHVP